MHDTGFQNNANTFINVVVGILILDIVEPKQVFAFLKVIYLTK